MTRSGRARKPVHPVTQDALPPINAALPILLLRARESVMAWFRPHLREHGVTDHQWRVLRALAEAGRMEMHELSAVCEVQPPSLSRIMPKLAEQGLVQREVDAADQRRVLARLTPCGEALVARVGEGSTAIYRRLLDVAGQERLGRVQAALRDLIDTLDDARRGDKVPDAGAGPSAAESSCTPGTPNRVDTPSATSCRASASLPVCCIVAYLPAVGAALVGVSGRSAGQDQNEIIVHQVNLAVDFQLANKLNRLINHANSTSPLRRDGDRSRRPTQTVRLRGQRGPGPV